MVVLLNFLPVIIVVFMALFIRYAVPSKVGKWVFSLLTVGMLFVYFQIQPSYLPKGTVKDLPRAEFKVDDLQIQDRMRKTVSPEERDAQMTKAEKETNERINSLIEKSKSEKE